MSNFVKAENENWQKEVRETIQDLADSLSLSNNTWNAWELEFIESMSEKLDQDIINVSNKQYEILYNLWERL